MEPALLAHIKESNAKTEAWVAEDPSNRWGGLMSEDPAHWEARGIITLEQFKRDELLTGIYELSKDAFGYKPNMSFYNGMTTKQLEAAFDRISEQAAEEFNRELEEKIEGFIRFDIRIAEIQDLMGNDREDALRILIDAEGETDNIGFYGYGIVEYDLNIEDGSIKKWLEA